MECACREVIATEVAKASVAAALYNIEGNKLSNVHVARLSSEEFVQAWKGEREFFRMKGLPDVRDRKFQTLLVCLLCYLPLEAFGFCARLDKLSFRFVASIHLQYIESARFWTSCIHLISK